MKYNLKIESRARKDLQSLNPIAQKRIAKKLKYFIEQSDPLQFSKKLVDSSGGDYRWRVGHYRVVFDLSGEEIRVLRVQHRKDVYRK
jgi:mRNA interferase RelE/StbE